MIFRCFIIVILSFLSICAFAQERKKQANINSMLYEANDLYHQHKYAEAVKKYNQAQEKNNQHPLAFYNQGNALMQTKKYEAARKQFEKALTLTGDKNLQAKAYHNIGNSFMEEKNWKSAVDAYKNALRRNPSDRESKYNLAYAQEKLKQQEQQKDKDKQDKKDENKDDKEDKKDEQKPQDKDKKDKDQKEKDKQSEEEKKKEEERKKQQQAPPEPQKMTEQRAAEMLNAVQQSEKKVQERKAEAGKTSPKKLDKDW